MNRNGSLESPVLLVMRMIIWIYNIFSIGSKKNEVLPCIIAVHRKCLPIFEPENQLKIFIFYPHSHVGLETFNLQNQNQ